ncbi:hypothetical protein CGZ75_23720 [Paenibacillus herberti]|uniref:DUF2500 domain-containing protein n=1 Tax=Paenibacillus herberti TaxID=1619309 RepID=A0A229NTM5_9BACL|nr:hypothetical protein CGZ75_23720 [Paenibacillus herberti]
MDYFIWFFVLIFLILIISILIKIYLPVREYDCNVIDKNKTRWNGMSASSKMTSYEFVVITREFKEITVIVLNPEAYNNVSIGDHGKLKVRGRFLIEFIKI